MLRYDRMVAPKSQQIRLYIWVMTATKKLTSNEKPNSECQPLIISN